tara:strand:+ start:306 stop:1124 length:819 start_codon:yes stop_codon:yes gene_type:complete
MTKNLDKEGLKSVFDIYDFFFIDLWGVIHNGIVPYKDAVNVLHKLLDSKKEFVLLTNAPRPNKNVKSFLEKMGLNKSITERVFTSGEAALNFLKKKHLEDTFYHIGPPRDFTLFADFKKNKTQKLSDCEYLLCTGLYDDHAQDLDYYKKLFENFTSKEMICTNPDLIVDKGEKREYCAGSVAMIFEKLGGKVIYFGKPHPEVYNQSIEKEKKNIIAIGDNLRTDIKGANNMSYDSLFVTGGIHKEEIGNEGVKNVLNRYAVKSTYHQSKLQW